MSSDPLDPNLGRLHEFFEAQVRRTPGATAVVAGADRLTYAEVDGHADRIAAQLRALGAAPERLVGVCLPRDAALVPGIIGALKSGAAYVPLDPAHPPLRLRQIAEDARMELVLATAATAGIVAGTGARPVLIDQLPAAGPPGPPRSTPANLAYVLFTSGSTGRAKGAALEHHQALTFVRWCAGMYTSEEVAGSLAAASICFDLSILEVLVPLFVGGTVIVAENLLALPTLPAAGEVTMLVGVPSAVATLVATAELPPNLRTLNIGGEVLTRALCDRVYANPGVRRIVNVYGPTECTPACLMHEVGRDEPGEPPLGRVIGGAELSVRDPDGHPVPDGALGELWIAGPGVGRGYVNRPELTAERYVADRAAAGGRRYRSGDLVRRVGGVYYFAGRLDDQVKVRGQRVELGEVRAVLAAHPAVRVAAALAPVDATGNRSLAAYVEPEPGAAGCTEPELRAYLGERLPGYMVPSRIIVMDRIPLNPSGKVDRAALPSVGPGGGGHPYEEPATERERRLAAIVADVLGLARVGRTDRFTELGGHSLAAARVAARVSAETGVPVSMEWFLGNPTVAALASHVGSGSAPAASAHRAAGRQRYPLTGMQRQFWTARRVSPNPTVTMVAVRFGLAGLPGAAPLAAALDAIVARHEVLRSTVSDAGGELLARVHPPLPVPLVEHDLRAGHGGAGRAAAAEIAAGLARQALDPAQDPPLLRAALIWLPGTSSGDGAEARGAGRGAGDGLDDNRAELVVAIDHIAFDGVSIALFMRELAAGVAAAGRGDDPRTAVPAPALQVGDVAAAGAAPDPATLERDAGFWRAELAGARPPYDLGTRRDGPPGNHGARVVRPLDPALLDAVSRAAVRAGGTRSAGLLAALAILLDALTGRPDVVAGVAAAYRDLPGTDRTIGPLLGVLPVRLRLDDDPSFGTLLVRALAATRRALAHRSLPAADLVDSVPHPPGASPTPVVLSVHPEDDPVVMEDGGLRVELLGELDCGAAPNELAIYVSRTAHGPQLQIEYDVARFSAADAGAFADRYLRLLAEAAADPDRPVSSFQVLTGSEADWLAQIGAGGAPPPARPVVADIAAQAARRPDAVAVVGPAGEVSYAELLSGSERLAVALAGRGAGPGTAVGVCLPRDHHLPATVLGVLRCGAAYLPLDPEQPGERLRQLLRDAGVRLVVATPRTAPALAGLGAEVVDADALVAEGGSAPRPGSLADPHPDSLAYVLFTSGSTGRPKGVEITHANLAAYVAAMRAEPGYGAGDTFLAVSPLWFDLSCFDLWLPLSIGARIAIADRETTLDGFALARWLDATGVTAMDVPPTLLRMLLAAGWAGGPVRVISGGEALDAGLAQQLLGRVPELWNAYGPTETTVTVTVQRITAPATDPIPIGHPVAGTRLSLRDRAGRLSPPGVVGELWIGGPQVARGYRGQPELTARGFVTDPVVAGARCYRSGDLARWRPDGSLEFAGRADDQLKVHGYRIEPGEVEAALRDHPVVAHAAVTANGSGLVGYVVPRPDTAVDLDALAAHLRRRLPAHLVPAQWSVLDRLPTTSSGKVDRRALPAPAPPRPEQVAPEGELAELVAEVWAEVLGRDDIGGRDDFLAIGGNSLGAVRVAAGLRERLGVEVPARMLFQSPVLADFATELERVALAQIADEGGWAMTEALDRQDEARRLLTARLTASRTRPGRDGIPPRPDPEAPAPLSPAQSRILFASQYEPASPAYNVPLVLHLRGRLDRDALVAAVRDLADRHGVLRSVVAGGAMHARPVELVPVTFDDLTGAGAEAVARRLFAEATRLFTLESDSPLRAACLRLGPEHHALALTIHHVAADASSNAILVADLARLYTARVTGEPPPAPPRLQYADVAAWERSRDPHRVEPALRWWRDRLRDLPPVLELPLDHPRPSELDSAGDCVALELTGDLSARVREVAAARQSTVSAVLLAAWQALLGRVAGTADVPVGVITSSRRHPDAEFVPGCFVDTLVVRGDLSGEPTGEQLLDRARDGLLDAMSHAEVPLDRVVEAVRPERVPGVTPLFQAVLNVYSAPDAVTGFAGLTAELEETFTRTARFDVSVAIADPGPAQPLRGRLIYRTALFDRATAVRLRDWYVRLLAELLAGPERPVARLPIADITAAAPALTGPRRDYPMDAPVHAAIEEHARAAPDATAVLGPDGRLTYQELIGRAGRLARRLRAAGAGPDTPVAVLAEPGVDLPVGMLAAMLAGGAYLPLDPDTPPGRVVELLETAGCPVLLTQRRLNPRFDGADRPVIAIDDDPGAADGDLPPARPTDLAYAIFTSGSTGQPKPVAVEHRGIVHYLRAVFERLGEPAGGGRSFALLSTAAADLGMTCLLGALTTGGTLHLLDRATAVDPGALSGYLARHPVDVMKLVPSHLLLLARHGDLAGVLPRRLLILAGEACPWSLVDQVVSARPDLAVQSHYGPTETTVAVLACDIAEVPPERRSGYVPLGRPLANVDGHVVDAAGQPLPDGLVGELVIAGPSVARGYLAGGATGGSAAFVRSASGERRYRTGDRVRVRADGTVEFHGRIDDQVKIRGYRVEPGEVAAALRRLPGVADAVVLGEEGRLLAWLVPSPGSTIEGAAVLAELREQIPEHLVPAAATVVEALPLGPNGKVDRGALPRPEAAPATRTAPETETEREIAALWQELLGCEVGRDDDFFALGGDSFRAVMAIRRMGRGLRAIDLFTHPTVRGLAALLEPAAGAAEPAPEGLIHRLAGPPAGQAELTVVCVPYGGGSGAAYRPLAQALGSDRVAVLAIELPGHDPAEGEELLGLDEVVRRCAGELAALAPRPVLVYGHCVGTALAVALARRLAGDGHELAGVVLGASFPAAKFPGRAGELLNRVLPTDRWLPDRSYRDALRVMGALIDEAGADGDTDAALLLRALRHDAREAEAWFTRELARPRPHRLAVPVLSVIGERDRGTELYQERYQEWAAFAERVELATVPRAGHYFLNHQAGELAAIITGALARWRGGDPPPVTSEVDAAGQRARRGLRAFRTVAYGQLVSLIGTQLSAFALGVWVYQSTGRLMDFAMITMLALVPAIVVAPLGGVLTDRYDRRRIMLASDTVSAVAVGSLALLYWADRLELWHILLAVTAGSVATAVQRPAWLASIAQLVPKPYLVQANALAQLGTGLGTLVAPLAGGVLVVAIGLPGVILIDMATFLVAVATLVAVRFPARLFRKRDEDFRSAFAGGWRFILRRPPIIRMTLYFIPVNYLGAITIVLVTPLVLDLASPVALGAVTAAGGLGAALGSLAMIAWGGTGKRAHGMVGFVIGGGAGTFLIGLAPSLAAVSLVLAGAGLFLWWAATSVVNAHWMAIIQVKVGPHLQGRVLAVNQMLAAAMMPLGFVTAPALAERLLGTGPLLLGSGAALLAWGALGLCYRPLRELEADLPDAVAGAEIPDDLDEVQAQIDNLER